MVSGARLGEILGLTWDRVNFDCSTITIDQAVDTQKRKLKADTKTDNAPRTITLDATTMDMLYQHKQNSKAAVVRSINKEHHLIFHSKDGGPLYYNATRRTLLRALKKINHEPIRIHDIRHSVITLLLQEGVPVITVAALVGQDILKPDLKTTWKSRVLPARKISQQKKFLLRRRRRLPKQEQRLSLVRE